MDIPILYEDDEIVVIDKPSGVIVNRAETVKGETLQDWMANKLQVPMTNNQTNGNHARETPLQDVKHGQELQGSLPCMYRGTSEVMTEEDSRYFIERLGMVHRLDKETSGVMVFAKTPAAFVELLRQFRERLVHKDYLALTHGVWKVKSGEINLPIGRRRDDRKKMGIEEDGRESVTEYGVVTEYPKFAFPKELKVDIKGYQGFSLVRFAPKTGRTHQIRVHSRAMGHPLVGDIQYAGRKRSREDRKWCPRVALQAQKLSLLHPRTGERVTFESKQVLGNWDGYLLERGLNN